MAFTVDPKDVMPETDPEEKAWLMLYGMIESYRKRGMVLKASEINLRFCRAAIGLADMLETTKKSPSQ